MKRFLVTGKTMGIQSVGLREEIDINHR
jgi:hypothetical protein